MSPNSRRDLICEGLKQAGFVSGMLVLLGGIGLAILYTRIINNDVVGILVGLTTAFSVSVLIGPIPTLLTNFDISDKQLLVMSVLSIIPYWACLGTIAGIFLQPKPIADTNQRQALSAKQISKRIRWTIEIIALVIAALFFLKGPIAGPNYISTGRHSVAWYRLGIINNLRQIDAAKNQFALEHKISPDYIPTKTELAVYLYQGTNFFRNLASGPVDYVLNPISKPPYAVLDKDWRIPRRGWLGGFTITNGTVFQLP